MITVKLGTPSEKQRQFMLDKHKIIAYGGARGGGKSWAIRTKAVLLAAKWDGIKILIVRRSYPELKSNHIEPLRMMLGKTALYNEQDKQFLFPNGSKIVLRFCANLADTLNFQGQEYDIIAIDEATHISEEVYQRITACLRGVNDFPKRIYLTCNPGGVGHAWVKRLFIDREYREGEIPEDYSFIQALVTDNKALMESDPSYVRMLDSLPPTLRAAWRDGDWSSCEGSYFGEFRMTRHVISPVEIPSWWRRYRVFDYGLDMLAMLWIAVDGYGRAYVYRELHESGLIVSEACRRIHEMSGDDVIYETIGPPDLAHRTQDTGKSVREIFSEHGVDYVVASNARVDGWLCLHEYLKPAGDGIPMLQIQDNCRVLIKHLPLLQVDERDPNDAATEPHEITHICDALRYFCITHKCNAKEPVKLTEAEIHKNKVLNGRNAGRRRL